MTESSTLALRALHSGAALPLLAQARRPSLSIAEVLGEGRALAEGVLLDCGAILFRGFSVAGVAEFRAFAAGFGHPLLGYEFGSTPRSRIEEGVYTSTEYPAHQSIPLHNEQSYSREWPMKIWFHCELPASHGGETPIVDSREVYRRIDPEIRRRFSERGVMYVRNYGNGLDVPWPQVFGTSDRAAVEQYCARHSIVAEWRDDGELRTRQVCQAVAEHPRTRAWVWFNQAHLFHISNLEPEVREALLDAVEPEDLPRNAYYGDGAPIEDAVLEHIRGVLSELEVRFAWQRGDVLMLDNMLVAHARAPFSGPRKVVVAMAQPYSLTAS